VNRFGHLWLLGALGTIACSSSHSRGAPAVVPGCSRTGCVEVVYKRDGEPRRGLRVDDSDVYWSEVVSDPGGARRLEVLAAPKNGGGPVRDLGPWDDYQATEAMVIDATHVSFLHQDKLARVRKDGGQRVELTIPRVSELDPGPLVDAGDAVLVGGHACKFLARIPKDGSTAQIWPVSTRPVTGGDTGVEVDGPLYYCASGNDVHVLDTRTGAARELVNYAGRAGSMRRVGKDLYWADLDNPTTNDYAIVRLSEGSSAPVAVGQAFGATTGLLFDEGRNRLYWLTGLSSSGCTLGVLDLGTGKTSTLAQDLDNWGASAQDRDYVYWAASRAVMRAHK
jgi:hypothetical protein